MDDFGFTDDLDLMVVDGEYIGQENNATTVITAFFTDERGGSARGYWLDVRKSEIWQYEQARLMEETASDIREAAKDVADRLVKEEQLYERIDADAYIANGVMTLDIQCYNNGKTVFARKFAI